MISQIYLIAFLVGLVYAIIAGIMSGISGGDHDGADGHEVGGHEAGEHDFHADHAGELADANHAEMGVDGHEIDVAHSHAGDSMALDAHADAGVALTPVSPVTIATFITSFGGVGLVTTEALKFPLLLSLISATGSGFIIAGVVLYGFNQIFKATQSSSEARVSTLVGIEAQVITPIPANGLGEIAYVSRGTRFTGPARSMTKQKNPKNSEVVVTKITGTTFYVMESADEKLRNVD